MLRCIVLILTTASVLVAGAWNPAMADVVRVPGTLTSVPNRIDGQAVGVLQFELPALRQGTGLQVQSAVIDWDHAAVTRSSTVRYETFDARILGGQVTPNEAQLREVLAGEPLALGVFYPQDYARLGKGHLRIDVRDRMREMVSQGEKSLQLVVTTGDMTPTDLASAAGDGPILVVRYGFLGPLKSALSQPDRRAD